ncbi:MAG TPA: hypothetical protein VGC98_14485 [Thermoleophilaceae bacterium]
MGAYAVGAAFFAVTLAASCATTAFVLRRLHGLAGAVRWLAGAVILTAALVAAHLIPGVLGVLTRGTVAVAAILCAILAWRLAPHERPGASAPEEPEPAGGTAVGRVLGVAAGAAIAVCVAAYYRTELTRSVTSDDMLNFHLPLVARWIQSGSFWPVVDFLPYDTTGNYPQNGDVLMLASVLPWRADTFARLAVVPYTGLAGLATYALGCELRASRARAALMACVVASIPILLSAGIVSALPDVVMYGMFGAGLVFLVRGIRTRLTSDALLGGLALGLAFGTKWYAVPAVGVVVVLFAGALAAERLARRTIVRLVGLTAGAVVLSGGFWLVRNAVESGSPFFPAGWLPVGARSDVGNPAPRTDFPIAHYLLSGNVWRHVILPDELRAFGVGGILLLAGLVAAAVMAVAALRRGEAAARRVAWVVLVAAALAVVYVVTPNTASGFDGKPVLVYYSARYLVPAAVPAAAALAWAATRAGRFGLAVDVLAVVAVADGLRRAFDLSVGALAVGVVAVAAGGAFVWAYLRLASAGRRRALTGMAVALTVLAAVGGYAVEHRFSGRRLRGQDAAVDRFLATTRGGDRVGLAEQWSVLPPSPVLAMFGDRLRNRVSYVGEHSEGVNKPYRTPGAFAAALRRGRYDWLMVGRGVRPTVATPAMRWAPASGYRLVTQTMRLALYRRAQRP